MKMSQIREAFDAIYWAFDNQTVNWPDRLLDQCKAEEREHRGFMPDFRQCHTSDTISVGDAARLFAVKRVAEYLQGAAFPTGKDYLHCQKSCFIAAGMVDEFRDKIQVAWRDQDISALAALDYTDFVKVRKDEAA